MKTSCMALALPVNCSINRRRTVVPADSFDHSHNSTLSSALKPMLRALPQLAIQTMKKTASNLVDAFVDSVFEFVDQPLLPSQSNFAPVEELGEAVGVCGSIEGQIPDGFPDGVYIRNGANPLFGGLKSTKSMLGRSSSSWVEGEGMLHALYIKTEREGRSVLYNNRHVESDTYVLEKQRDKPAFLPALQGDSPAILSAFLLNLVRFGKINKRISNTNVFEHGGKFYSIAENDIPQQIDIFTLKTIGNWDVGGAWNRPFSSHPKKAPGTGELVTLGFDAFKPFTEVGIIYADGKLVHKVDIKLERASFCHEMGVTQSYNVIMDFPLILDFKRLLGGGPLIKYCKDEYARIGVMPRYGDGDSIQWFDVEPCMTFHIINSFEDGHEVVVWACRALDTVFPKPELGWDKFEFPRCYEWRLNMQSGEVKEKYLCGERHIMDFPVINPKFTGIKNRFGYTQVVDPTATSAAARPKYGGIAKLSFEEPCTEFSGSDKQVKEAARVKHHMFEKNVFCTGSAFVPRDGGVEEDDGWIITFVHNEDTEISQVRIIDTHKFSEETVAIITLPRRVPYGFHGAFMPISF